MSSDAEVPELAALFQRILSRNRDLSLFIPFMLGLATATTPRRDGGETTEQEQQGSPADQPNPAAPRDRVILINPVTQGTLVIEGASGGFDSLLRDLMLASQSNGGGGQPPASKASIEAMPTVEIGGEEDGGAGECVICLEEWKSGEVVKEMPCKHRFHGGCVEKWLGIHGSCPVCRYQMPVEEKDSSKKTDTLHEEEAGGEERRIQREIWVSFSVGGRMTDTTTGSSPNSD